MIKYMLDTNICIFTIKNKPQVVREAFNRHHGQLCISAVTLMELIYGAEKSAAPEKTWRSSRASPPDLKSCPSTTKQQHTPE